MSSQPTPLPDPADHASDAGLEDLIEVIARDDRRPAGPWTPQVPSPSAADAAYQHLRDLQHARSKRHRVRLPDPVLLLIARSAYDAADLAHVQPSSRRSSTGTCALVTYDALTLTIDLSSENVRHNEDASYDADQATRARQATLTPAGEVPGRAPGGMFALPLPVSHPTFAQLVHRISPQQVAEATDRNYASVLADNRQPVGERVIEAEVTAVVTEFVDPAAPARTSTHLVAVDGNSRTASGVEQIPIDFGWLPNDAAVRDACRARLARGRRPLLPSELMLMTPDQRRTLSRKVAAEYSKVYTAADLRVGDLLPGGRTATQADLVEQRRQKNEAARALNALIVPVRLIVGYVDDDPQRGNSRFDGAVRDVLRQMNSEGKKLSKGSNHGFLADSAVLGLHGVGALDDAHRDLLMGRAGVVAACRQIGIDPDLPDLRAAVVIRELTRSTRKGNAALRVAMGRDAITVTDRQELVSALALRSYSASLTDKALLRTVRLACESGMLWKDLTSDAWCVTNVRTDQGIDELLARAVEENATERDSRRHQARPLLAVLGMCALVFTGNLRTPGGSAEAIVRQKVDRERVGAIVERLSKREYGLRLLADAVKRSRAGLPLRFLNADDLQLGDRAEREAWSTADFNAQVRALVKHGSVAPPTSTAQEDIQWGAVEELTTNLSEAVEALERWRDEEGITELLPWAKVEASLEKLDEAVEAIKDMSERNPERRRR